MNEFICPNGRMSVNGVCPIFEGDDGQVKDFTKPKSFDDKYSEIEDIEKDNKKKSFFEFDFERPTESTFEKADNIISKNIQTYNSFVERNLGIPSNLQTGLRIGTSAINAFSGGSLMSVVAPFAIPFVAGAALNKAENKRIQNITMQDTQGDVKTFPTRIMNIQPTQQDIYRGGGGDRPSPSPAKTSQGVTSSQHRAFRS